MRRDPIKILEKFLLDQSIMSEEERNCLQGTMSEEVEETVKFARESAYPDENDLLDNVFKTE